MMNVCDQCGLLFEDPDDDLTCPSCAAKARRQEMALSPVKPGNPPAPESPSEPA